MNRISEKRYYVNSALYLCDNDLSNTLSIFECADLLNQLTKENEQLKKEHKIAIDEMITDYKNLEKENEQLKYDNFMFKGVIETFQKFAISERKKLERQVDEQQATIEQLQEENASLKQRIRDIKYNNCD